MLLAAREFLRHSLPSPHSILSSIACLLHARPTQHLEEPDRCFLEKALQGPDVAARIVDAAVKINGAAASTGGTEQNGLSASVGPKTKSEELDTIGDFLSASENDVYPYNAYMHPFTHLKKPENMSPAMAWPTRLQRLLALQSCLRVSIRTKSSRSHRRAY